MTYEYILFDLDGTITESGTGIINSVKFALKKMNIGINDESVLRRFVGPPLMDSFMHFYEMNEKKAEQAVRFYREYFSERGMFENKVYDGFIDTVKRLKNSGKVLAVATSKPEEYAVPIADKLGFSEYFDKICGATMDSSRTAKSDVIRYTLETMGLTEQKGKVLMVGDRENDIYGAKENGIASMGVLYGYGERKELEDAGADYIAETVRDISDIILSI